MHRDLQIINIMELFCLLYRIISFLVENLSWSAILEAYNRSKEGIYTKHTMVSLQYKTVVNFFCLVMKLYMEGDHRKHTNS